VIIMVKKNIKIVRKKTRNNKQYTTGFMLAVVLVLSAVLFVNSGNYITGFAAGDEWNKSDTSVLETEATPTIGTVTLTDGAGSIDLTANGTSTVYCHAIVTDTNGEVDVDSDDADGNVTIYDSGVEDSGCELSGRDCYRNTTFTVDTCDSTYGTNLETNCTFTVDMQFNAINTSTWKCNMTIEDATGNLVTVNSADTTVAPLLAIGINTSSMGFGQAVPLAFAANEIVQEIANDGNVNFDLRINGSSVLTCSGAGEDIGVGNISYNITGVSASLGTTNLTDTLVTLTAFNLAPNTAEDATPFQTSKNTWWKLWLPQASASRGTCTGEIWFFALQD
jgi:hypothetical protein